MLSKKIILTAFAATMGFANIANAEMVQVYYSDFSDTSNLQLNGDAAVHTPNSEDMLTLTGSNYNEAGSAFSLNAFTLPDDAAFSAFFSFNMVSTPGLGGDQNGGYGGDGLTFTLQTVSNTAGSQGGGLGYAGLENSIAIEFDTWQNDNFGDISTNHVGVNVNGDVQSVVAVDELTRFNDGDSWYVWVDYDGYEDTLSVRYSLLPSRPEDASISYNVDLVNILGSSDVYVGFTASTGGAFQSQSIEQFAFENQFVTLVEEGSIADLNATNGGMGVLLASGLCLFGLRKRKK
jgi:hypothetical protein